MAKILIADDAEFVRLNMRRMLASYNHQLIEACNGKEAIEIFKKELPDLVIMDITMPELDGISAVREIRKFKTDAKVIMCSSMGQQLKIIDAIQAGASDFIVKPYKEAHLMDAVNKALSLS